MPCTMERREHYLPEDIESLLHERGFDELLEEERAFVLRHLSGRDEYEAMRALLHQVREDDRAEPPLTDDGSVRHAVMAAFRAQQQPQWRLWLNSVGGLLWPKEMSDLWKPALAFGSLALLVVVGLQLMRSAPITSEKQVAQLEERKRPEPTLTKENNDPVTAPALDTEKDIPSTAHIAEQEVASSAATIEQAPMEEMADQAQESPVVEDRSPVAAAKYEAAKVVATDAGSASHIVTERELATNMSTTNATGRAFAEVLSRKDKRSTEEAVVLSNSPELLALLNTGW